MNIHKVKGSKALSEHCIPRKQMAKNLLLLNLKVFCEVQMVALVRVVYELQSFEWLYGFVKTPHILANDANFLLVVISGARFYQHICIDLSRPLLYVMFGMDDFKFGNWEMGIKKIEM